MANHKISISRLAFLCHWKPITLEHTKSPQSDKSLCRENIIQYFGHILHESGHAPCFVSYFDDIKATWQRRSEPRRVSQRSKPAESGHLVEQKFNQWDSAVQTTPNWYGTQKIEISLTKIRTTPSIFSFLFPAPNSLLDCRRSTKLNLQQFTKNALSKLNFQVANGFLLRLREGI